MAMGEIEKLEARVNAAGATPTRVARTHIYGVRYFTDKDAGTAGPRRTAIGVGLASVWNGPKQVFGGAPVLRRDHK